jgi:hypothetical protein
MCTPHTEHFKFGQNYCLACGCGLRSTQQATFLAQGLAEAILSYKLLKKIIPKMLPNPLK